MAKRLSTINHKLFGEAKKYIAGGVNSPARSFRAVGGIPIFVNRAKGSHIFSEDGKTYIDYCLSWGALILGHSHPRVISRLKKAVPRGTTYGIPTKLETEFAKVLNRAIPSMESIRLVNSGTEAAMSVVRLARGFTKKNKIIKFKECYHGHSDYFLAGKSQGLPQALGQDVISLDFNNLEQVEAVFRKDKDIACVILEPIAANSGLIYPDKDFLSGLRRLTLKYKALLIFDEVITGFRFCFGGYQNILKIEPDLTCLGKIVGGGFPLACFGGKRKIMNCLSPLGNIYQAGTLSGNPVAVSAGLETLDILKDRFFYKELNEKSETFYERLRDLIRESKLEVKLKSIGAMFNFEFYIEEEFNKFFHILLSRGIYLSPSASEVCFLSSAHSAKDLDYTANAVRYALWNFA